MTSADAVLVMMLVVVAVAGAFIGRFLYFCSQRFPRFESLADQLRSLSQPRRPCHRCEARPTLKERLPIVSWIFFGGRCHACGSKFPSAIVATEIVTALLLALLYWREIPFGGVLSSGGLTSTEGPFGPDVIETSLPQMVWLHVRFVFHAIMVCGLIVASDIDRRLRIIPDGSTVPIMLLAIPVSLLCSHLFVVPIWFQDPSTAKYIYPMMPDALKPMFVPWDASEFVKTWPHLHGLLVSVAGMTAGLMSVVVIRQIGFLTLKQEAMGFGDAVLMAMIGSVLGWQPVVAVFLVGAPMLAVFFALANWIFHGDNEIPYGPFLCAGTVLLLLTWPISWPFAKRFLDMGPLLILMAIAGALSLAAMLSLIRIVKRLFGFDVDDGPDDGGWTSADHLSYYNGERPDERTGLWPQPSAWPGTRSGRGLQPYRNWRNGK